MIGARHDLELDGDSGAPEAVGEADALVARHPGICLAVLEEERWGAGVNVADGAGRPGDVAVFSDRSAEQVRLEAVGRLLVEGEQVGHGVPTDDSPNLGYVVTQCRQSRQMPTGRGPPEVHAVGRDIQHRGLLGQPVKGKVQVVALGGEAGFAAEPVVGGGDDEAGGGEPFEESVRPRPGLTRRAAAMALPPAPAVDVDEQRARTGGQLARPVDVELEGAVPLPLGVHDRLVEVHRRDDLADESRDGTLCGWPLSTR